MSDLISVIIPCYNQAQYLPEALDSVLAQTYTKWECIIVNDGSPDNSEEIALNYCSKDARFKYFKKENGGLSAARNAGLKMAKGSWIQFLDCDDYIEPEKFKLSIGLIDQNPSVALVVSDFKMFVDDRLKATPAFCELNQDRLNFESILYGWDVEFNIPIHSGLFKADLFVENHFIETLKANEDWVMWLNIFKQGINAVYLDHTLAYYRINPGSMTKDKTFARNSLAEAYKFILQVLPKEYVINFACNIVDKYKNASVGYENDLEYFKNKRSYRVEKKIKDSLRKFLPAKKNKY